MNTWENMKSWIDWILRTTVAKIIAGILIVSVFIALIVVGFGFLSSVLLFILLGIIIFLGMLRELAGAIVIASLFHMMHDEIGNFLTIWFSSPKMNETFNFFLNLGIIKSVMIIFFFAALISFATGSIKIFRISSSSESKSG